MICFSDSGAYSAPGVLGVHCFCEVLSMVTVVPMVPLVSDTVSVSCCCDSGACGAPGVFGVPCYFCEVLL